MIVPMAGVIPRSYLLHTSTYDAWFLTIRSKLEEQIVILTHCLKKRIDLIDPPDAKS